MDATARTSMTDRQWEFFLELAKDWGVTILVLHHHVDRVIEMHGPEISIRHLQGVLLGLWMSNLNN